MINIPEFTKRLKKVIDYYGLSASAFADELGVQRSSISHILSGRNKPSLDFVMKVLQAFPEVELYWLLNGKGIFPKEEIQSHTTSTPTTLETKTKQQIFPLENTSATTLSASEKKIDKIVIFYTDGTFEHYQK